MELSRREKLLKEREEMMDLKELSGNEFSGKTDQKNNAGKCRAEKEAERQRKSSERDHPAVKSESGRKRIERKTGRSFFNSAGQYIGNFHPLE